MTTCTMVRPMISALIDNELSTELGFQVRQHLAACEDCRQEYESLLSLDVQLQDGLKITAIEAKIADAKRIVSQQDVSQQDAGTVMLRNPGDETLHPIPRKIERRRTNWIGWVAVIAATLLIAMFMLRESLKVAQPDDSVIPQHSDGDIVATLVRATGVVEVLEPGSHDWGLVNETHPAPLRKGSRLRTNPSVLCELRTAEDGKIRLNQAAELILHDASDIELIKGQIWCLAADSEGMKINLPLEQNFTPFLASLKCPSASEVQCTVDRNQASCDSISTGSAETELSIGSTVCTVNPGETVSLGANQSFDRKPAEHPINKVWQLPLLAVDGTADRELTAALTDLLAPIGRSKLAHLNEQEIRLLGPAGAIPLLAFAVSETRPEQLSLRRTAVVLGADLADRRSVALLNVLAMDSDPNITALARRALERLGDEIP